MRRGRYLSRECLEKDGAHYRYGMDTVKVPNSDTLIVKDTARKHQ